jgi:hypothetical protein
MTYGEAFYSQFKKTIVLNEYIEDFESVNDQLRYLKTETKEQHVKSGKIKEMQDFYDIYIHKQEPNQKKKFMQYYKGKSTKQFTNLMNYYIIPPIIRGIYSEKIITDNEYYNVDVYGYIDRKSEITASASTLNINPHLWDLKVVVEHENNDKDWTDELVKLVFLNCDLKVLIGYNYSDRRECDSIENYECGLIKYAEKCLLETNRFFVKDSNRIQEYLIIFGNRKPHRGDYLTPNYKGYLFRSDDSEHRGRPLDCNN